MTGFDIEDKYLQVIAHLYRAEINRLTIYRQRLDIISNWSISLLATILVLYLGNTILPENMILFLIVPNFLFSWIEARRYRYYRISQYRTRLIEKGFYGAILNPHIIIDIEPEHPKKDLYENLVCPAYNISWFQAWIIRCHRNYIWLLYFILFTWTLKLFILHAIRDHKILVFCVFGSVFLFHLFLRYMMYHKNEIDI